MGLLAGDDGIDLGGALCPGGFGALQLQVEFAIGFGITRGERAGAGGRALIDDKRRHR